MRHKNVFVIIKMNPVTFFLTLVLSISFRISQGQAELQLTLDECLDKALEDNQQLSLQSLELERESMNIRSGAGFIRPEINGYARFYQYLDDQPIYVFPENGPAPLSGFVPLGAPLNFYSGVTVNQPLFDARMIRGRGVREKAEEIIRLRQEMNEDEIRYEVIKTFYQIRIVEESDAVLVYNQGRLKQLESITRSAVENEMALSSTLEELRLRMSELDLAIDEINNNREKLFGYMRLLCHIPEETAITLITRDSLALPEFSSFNNADSITGAAWEILELQKALSEESLQQTAAETYPTVDLFMAFQWLQQEGYGDLFTSQGTWFNQHLIGVKLNIPIMNPNNRKSTRQEAKINQEIISVQQELVLEKNKLERDNALRDMKLARKNVELAARRLDLYNKQYNQEEVRYEQQFSSLRDLLEAEEKVRTAILEEQRRKIEYFISILEVYRAYGVIESFNELK